jgi:hypothetical protein
MDIVLSIIISLMVGLFGGIVLTKIFSKPKTMGTLRMYQDEDDGPYLFLELATDPHDVISKKEVTFKVNPDDYVSRN